MKITMAVLVSLLIAPAGAQAQGARLQLDHLDRLAGQAAESVNITIDPSMLKLATAFLKGERENVELKEMLSEIRGIYVRSFEFDREDAYSPDDVSAVRKQLAAPGWSRLVTVDSKRDRELVEIYSWREGNEAGGLAILVSEPKELTVVNTSARWTWRGWPRCRDSSAFPGCRPSLAKPLLRHHRRRRRRGLPLPLQAAS